MTRAPSIHDYVDRLGGKVTSENTAMCCCPAHDDRTPSLSVKIDNGKPLVKCFAKCSQEVVIHELKKLGLWQYGNRTESTKPRAKKNKPGQSTSAPLGDLEKTYDYLDLEGKLLFQVCRFRQQDGSKTFRQRRPDGNGGWKWSVEGIDLVPYRLPELIHAEEVFIVEGEKDADRLNSEGLTATCNAQGAGKWKASYAQYFRGKRIYIIPDNDDAGQKHALDVARSLHGVAAEVKVLNLPDLPDKGDVSDWLDAGGTQEELLALVEKCPTWAPEPGADEDASVEDRGRSALNLFDWKVSNSFQGEPQPRQYLIEDIFPMGQASLVGGGGGVGKSFQLLALAVAVTGGAHGTS